MKWMVCILSIMWNFRTLFIESNVAWHFKWQEILKPCHLCYSPLTKSWFLNVNAGNWMDYVLNCNERLSILFNIIGNDYSMECTQMWPTFQAHTRFSFLLFFPSQFPKIITVIRSMFMCIYHSFELILLGAPML